MNRRRKRRYSFNLTWKFTFYSMDQTFGPLLTLKIVSKAHLQIIFSAKFEKKHNFHENPNVDCEVNSRSILDL